MKLPKGWKLTQLSDTATIVRGSSPRPAGDPRYFGGSFLPWITVGEVTKDAGMFLSETRSFLTAEGAKHTRILDPDTLILTNSGATLGVPKITKLRAGANDGIAAFLSPTPNKAFLYYFLESKTRYFREDIAPGVGQPNLNTELIGLTPLPLPPAPEQRKIADILSTWDEALETLDSLIAAKDRQKQALMQQLLTGKTRVKGAKGKWKKVRMGDVLERVFRPIDWHADLPLNLVSLRRHCGGLFRRPDVKGSEYKTQDLHEIRAGDFLISKRQVVHGAWGYVTPEFEGGHVSKEYAILDNRAPDKLHMPFFAWLAQTRRLIRLARVSSTGVHIEKLIFDPVVFLRESIRIPADLAEQQRIATILDTADQELTLLRTQRNALDQQKRGLMQRLLTGKIRVTT